MDRLLTVPEAVAYLEGVASRTTLYREHEAGKLAFTKIRSRTYIRQAELDRWLKVADRRAA